MQLIKSTLISLCILSLSITIYAQGEVLHKGQSAGSIGIGLATGGGDNFLLSRFGFNLYKSFEAGLSFFDLDNLGSAPLVPDASLYFGDIHGIKVSGSLILGTNDTEFVPSFLYFYTAGNADYIFTPQIGFVYAEDRYLTFGFDAKIGRESGLVFTLSLNTTQEQSGIIGLGYLIAAK